MTSIRFLEIQPLDSSKTITTARLGSTNAQLYPVFKAVLCECVRVAVMCLAVENFVSVEAKEINRGSDVMFQRMYPIMRAAAVLIYQSPPRGFGGTGEMGNTTFGGVGDGPEPEVLF